MRLTVNGKVQDTDAQHVAALVDALGFARGTVLVEHNGTALRPDEWAAARIQENDQIELLRIVAGG